MRTRNQTTGVVSRKVAKDLKVMTVYGKEVADRKHCPMCNTVKYKSEFYVESSSKKNNDNDVRNMCCSCWDIHNGKLKKRGDVGNTLIDFL